MKIQIMITYILSLFLFLSCGNKDKQTINSTIVDSITFKEKNYLSMKINGQEWVADHDVFGAFHPKGYDRAIIIAGSKGKKDKNEQTFNINLYKTSGPGTFNFVNGNKEMNVAQLGNLSAENYVCGSMMGFDMKVIVTKASSMPDMVEATFEGKMTCPTGEILTITEGKFYYQE